jgi:hypothetical protein
MATATTKFNGLDRKDTAELGWNVNQHNASAMPIDTKWVS